MMSKKVRVEASAKQNGVMLSQLRTMNYLEANLVHLEPVSSFLERNDVAYGMHVKMTTQA